MKKIIVSKTAQTAYPIVPRCADKIHFSSGDLIMIRIHSDFTGGNIRVKSIEGDTVYLENELRDSTIDWFYFAFCVEGAEGREIKFVMQKNRLGYFGPAVSHDGREWHWLGACDGDSFTYKFDSDEHRVYFAHSMLYHPDRFDDLCKRLDLQVDELCKSRKARSVPCLKFGEGEISIILTSRHHACESTGNLVLEGVITELVRDPINGATVFAVPFVDYDGVLDGDQGKSRDPHDHNRDYTDSPIYPEVRAIREYTDEHGCNFGFDFHSPWHRGGINDKIFVVRNMEEKLAEFDRFSTALESEITPDSMQYSINNDFPPNTSWNQPSTSFGCTMNSRPECHLAFTLESAYFGTNDDPVSADKLIELGKCFARAIKKYAASVGIS